MTAQRSGRGPTEVIDLEAELDRLFQQPLGAFVQARNALARRLAAANRPDAAEQVKSIAKPSSSAWALNQVYGRARDVYDAAIEAGDALRRAQAASFAGRAADLREAMLRRQQAVDAMLRQAVSFLTDAGAAPGPAIQHRMAASADALAAWGTLPGRPPAGRLVQDVAPPGFEALTGIAPGAGTQRPAARSGGRAPGRERAPGEEREPLQRRPRSASPRDGAGPSADALRQQRQREAEAARARRQEIADAETALRRDQAALRASEDDARRASDAARLAERAVSSLERAVADADAALASAREKAEAARARRDEAQARVEVAESERRRRAEAVDAARERLDALKR